MVVAWLLLHVVLLLPRWRKRHIRLETAAAAFVLASVTWLQVAVHRSDYHSISLGDGVLLLNFTAIPADSPPIRRLRRDVDEERRALATLFGVEPERLRVALFPSRRAMHQALGPGFGEPVARAQFLTQTIYISLADWNTSFRHELVHIFQSEWARRSPSRWARFLIRHDECLTESLAYHLAPRSGGIGARPVDYVNALDLASAEWEDVRRFQRISPTGQPLDEGVRRTVELFLCTYPWHVAGGEAQAVRLYKEIAAGASTRLPHAAPPPVGDRDLRMEALLGYVLAPHFRTRPTPDSRMRTVAAFSVEGGASIPERRALAAWNAENTPALSQRVAWEVVLDTLGTGVPRSRASALHARARELSDGELTDQAALARATAGLRQIVEESSRAGYVGVAADAYRRLLDLESVAGHDVPTAAPPGIDRAFNRYHTDYVADVRRSFRASPPLRATARPPGGA